MAIVERILQEIVIYIFEISRYVTLSCGKMDSSPNTTIDDN